MNWKEIKSIFTKEREKESEDIKSQSWYFDPEELSDSDDDSSISDDEYEKLGWGNRVKNVTNKKSKMIAKHNNQTNKKRNVKNDSDIKSYQNNNINLKCYNIDEDKCESKHVEFQSISGEDKCESKQIEFQPISGETLYDENIDEKNEVWVRNNLRSYLRQPSNNQNKLQKEIDIIQTIENTEKIKGVTHIEPITEADMKPVYEFISNPSKAKQKSAPKQIEKFRSDAALNCPCCFTLLCLDCQRHSKFRNQYRAVFVLNCVVASNEILRDKDGETFKSVKCNTCNTEVAVQSTDEVYHFFNVFPSDPPDANDENILM